MGQPIGKSEHVKIQTSNEAYPRPLFFLKELLLGLAPTRIGTITLDLAFGSFTLLEPASH
jgi:hypothetical protein